MTSVSCAVPGCDGQSANRQSAPWPDRNCACPARSVGQLKGTPVSRLRARSTNTATSPSAAPVRSICGFLLHSCHVPGECRTCRDDTGFALHNIKLVLPLYDMPAALPGTLWGRIRRRRGQISTCSHLANLTRTLNPGKVPGRPSPGHASGRCRFPCCPCCSTYRFSSRRARC